MSVISIKQLLEAGVHFGHHTRRWNPKMAPFIFQERNGIHIIDLSQTVKRFDTAYMFVRDLAMQNGTILFIGTKKQAADAIGVVNATLNDFLRKGPDEAELQAARDHLVNSFAMQMDNNLKVLELIAMIGYYRLPLDYLDHWTEKVAQVTAADVKDAMNRRLDVGKMATVIVGQ